MVLIMVKEVDCTIVILLLALKLNLGSINIRKLNVKVKRTAV